MKQKMRLSAVLLLFLCFASFLVYGTHFNSFGPNTENIEGFFAIDETKTGLIMTVQSIGGIIMTIVLGLFGERINKLHGVAIGMAMLGIASALVGLLPQFVAQGSGYGLLLAFSLLAGLGSLTVDLLMNGVIADVYPDRKNTFLPYVHAFYGVGAMLAPLVVSLLTDPEQSQSFALPYLVLGVLAILLCAGVFLNAIKVTPQTPYGDVARLRKQARGNPAEVFADGRAWLFLGAGFLYLCFQTGLSAWLPQYCMELPGFTHNSSTTICTFYFLGALIMRLVSPLIYKKISVRNFYILTISVSAVLFLVILLVPFPPAVVKALIFVMGLLQGASVPALVILCSDTFPDRSASASSIIVLSISLAALICPSVMGSIMEAGHHLWAMLAILICLPLSIPLLLLATRKKK